MRFCWPAIQVASPSAQRKRSQPHRVEPNGEATSTREKVLHKLWVSHAKDELDVTNPIQTKAELSFAMAVMDKIGDWLEDDERIGGEERHEGSLSGGRLAACMWIHPKNGDIHWSKAHGNFS